MDQRAILVDILMGNIVPTEKFGQFPAGMVQVHAHWEIKPPKRPESKIRPISNLPP